MFFYLFIYLFETSLFFENKFQGKSQFFVEK